MKNFFLLGLLLISFLGSRTFAYQSCSTYSIDSLQYSISEKKSEIQNASYIGALGAGASSNYEQGIQNLQSELSSLENLLSSAQSEYNDCTASNEGEQSFSNWFDQGYKSYEKGAYMDAIVAFQNAINVYPNSINKDIAKSNLGLCYYQLAQGYFDKEDFNDAIIYYNKYLEINPNSYVELFNIGASYYNLKDYKNALDYYQKALSVTSIQSEINQVKESISKAQTIEKNLGTKGTTQIITDTGTINNKSNNSSSTSNELLNAYNYAYSIGITTQKTPEEANLGGTLLRSHMAKMMVNYAKEVLGKSIDTTKSCNFTDISDQTQELSGYIIEACQMGLMGSGSSTFNPNGIVTRAEFGTVLSRALYGNINDGGLIRYTNHLQAMYKAGIMKDISTPNNPEQRGYVMLMMMRAAKK